MSTIQLGACRTCTHNVDQRAKRCPNCGRKWPVLSNGQRSLHTWMIVVGVALLLLVLLPALTS